MTKPGRNDQCPCGSGKKYKRCCLPKEEAAAAERATIAAAERASAAAAQRAADRALAHAYSPFGWSDDGLDDASNRVVDLIHAGKLDEAEKAAEELLEKYPDVIDGFERLAMVHEARGNRKLAADYYRKAGDFIREHPDGFDPEVEAYMRGQAKKLDPPA